MRKIGITGTLQGWTELQETAFYLYWDELGYENLLRPWEELEFHHGMAEGVDEQVGNWICDGGFKVIGHPGITKSGHVWKRGKCRVWEERKAFYFLDRNRHIVQTTNELWAFPKERNTRQANGTWTPIRSGTWATIRHAEKLGRKVVIFWPDGDIEIVNRKK